MLFIACIGSAQEKTDPVNRFTYEYTYSVTYDSTKKSKATMLLDVIGSKTRFIDNNHLERLAFFNEIQHLSPSEKMAYSQGKAVPRVGTYMYIETDPNNITQYERISNTDFYWETPKNTVKWHIEPEVTQWNNLKVQKASTTFEGRKWFALFTNDITIKTGPYKFVNLPGFVVKAWDSENYFVFEFINNQTNVDTNINEFQNSKKYNTYEKITLSQKDKLNKNFYNKTFRAFWSETQPDVEQFGTLFPLDKKIGEHENPIDQNFRK